MQVQKPNEALLSGKKRDVIIIGAGLSGKFQGSQLRTNFVDFILFVLMPVSHKFFVMGI